MKTARRIQPQKKKAVKNEFALTTRDAISERGTPINRSIVGDFSKEDQLLKFASRKELENQVRMLKQNYGSLEKKNINFKKLLKEKDDIIEEYEEVVASTQAFKEEGILYKKQCEELKCRLREIKRMKITNTRN